MLRRRFNPHGRGLAAALAVTVAASTAGALPTSAAEHRLPDLRMVQASGNVSPYEARTARCPDGMRPFGGGLDSTPGHSLAATIPVDGSGWQVKAGSGTGAFDMTWYAMCATPPPGYEIVKQTVNAVPNGEARSVTCPSGKDMLAAGAEAKGHSARLVAAYIFFAASANVYYAVASGASRDADTVDLDVYAVCADRYPAATYVNKGEGDYANGDGPTWTCPNDTRVVSAGFNLGGLNGELSASKPVAANDWKFTGTNPNGSEYYLNGGLICVAVDDR